MTTLYQTKQRDYVKYANWAALVANNSETVPTTPWILADGVWDDSGTWQPTELWKDS